MRVLPVVLALGVWGANAPVVSAKSSSDGLLGKYVPLDGCAIEEGSTVKGPIKQCDAECCQRKCDANPQCNSISVFGVGKICYLKSGCIAPDAKLKVNKYTTWIKDCDGLEVDLNPAEHDLRYQSEIDVDETASVSK